MLPGLSRANWLPPPPGQLHCSLVNWLFLAEASKNGVVYQIFAFPDWPTIPQEGFWGPAFTTTPGGSGIWSSWRKSSIRRATQNQFTALHSNQVNDNTEIRSLLYLLLNSKSSWVDTCHFYFSHRWQFSGFRWDGLFRESLGPSDWSVHHVPGRSP